MKMPTLILTLKGVKSKILAQGGNHSQTSYIPLWWGAVSLLAPTGFPRYFDFACMANLDRLFQLFCTNVIECTQMSNFNYETDP